MKKIAFVVAVVTLGSSAVAAPAPFYKWASKLNGTIVCAQSSLGSGWQLASPAPYKDAGCRIPY